jgi:hypothetical protein
MARVKKKVHVYENPRHSYEKKMHSYVFGQISGEKLICFFVFQYIFVF